MTASALELRRVFGCFATGVTVVTCRVGQRTHGITVNSFTSVSLDPPLILICIDRRTIAYTLIPEARAFAVNILAQHQREISDYFAKRLAPNPDDELAEIPHGAGITGAPLIDGAIAVVECRLANVYPGGDHDIFVSEVVDARILSDESPLLFQRGRYPNLARS
jgi:flavin reductase (DIM6/NTAB) family NADH-FMN oxidoreductase RutF